MKRPSSKSSKNKAGTKSPAIELAPRRRRLFIVVTLLIPFILLAALEAGLRMADYGGNLDLVIKRKLGNRGFYSINRYVARRYFAAAGTTVPEPGEDTFEISKGNNTKRIFCIGESTMEGFPYEFNATAPSFLRDRIQTLLPQYNIEVINVGLSAVSSFVVLDFLQELMKYEPDLFVVYVGHNEFYGAYGVGSTVSIAGGPWMTRTTLYLLKFKTFLLLRDAYAKLRTGFSSAPPEPTGTMMGQMAANKTIPYHSPQYESAKSVYADNISRLIESAQKKNVPIIFSTLVSNLKDQSPFVSLFDEGTSGAKRAEWNRLVQQGDDACMRRDTSGSVASYAEACSIDSMNASAFFRLGTADYALQRFDAAKIILTRAKDLDALRFRATEEFQATLVNTCQQYHVPLARVDSAFEVNSRHNIVGNELILEHLHPNIDGYFLMAKVFADAIRQSDVLVPAAAWRMDLQKPDSVLMEESTVSDFDRTLGRLKVEFLKRRWPFTTGPTNFEFVAANTVESVVFRYIQKKIYWSDARYKLAELYAANKQFYLARKECLAVSKVIPFSFNPLLRVADYFQMEGKLDEAMAAYRRCIATEDNPYAHIKIGLISLEEEKASDALKELETAFRINEHFGVPLSVEASAQARYLYGVAFAKLGRFSEARDQAQRALAISPNNEDVRAFIQQHPSMEK